jgi:hypothetical protein
LTSIWAFLSLLSPPRSLRLLTAPLFGPSHAEIDQMQIDDTPVLTGYTGRPAPSIGGPHKCRLQQKFSFSGKYLTLSEGLFTPKQDVRILNLKKNLWFFKKKILIFAHLNPQKKFNF